MVVKGVMYDAKLTTEGNLMLDTGQTRGSGPSNIVIYLRDGEERDGNRWYPDIPTGSVSGALQQEVGLLEVVVRGLEISNLHDYCLCLAQIDRQRLRYERLGVCCIDPWKLDIKPLGRLMTATLV